MYFRTKVNSGHWSGSTSPGRTYALVLYAVCCQCSANTPCITMCDTKASAPSLSNIPIARCHAPSGTLNDTPPAPASFSSSFRLRARVFDPIARELQHGDRFIVVPSCHHVHEKVRDGTRGVPGSSQILRRLTHRRKETRPGRWLAHVAYALVALTRRVRLAEVRREGRAPARVTREPPGRLV